CARLGGRHRGREAPHVRDELGYHRDDRRRVGVLHHLHLPTVRRRPAGHDRHGVDGVPRWEGNALGPAAGCAPAGARATVARAERDHCSLVPDPVLGRIPPRDPAAPARDHPVGPGSRQQAPGGAPPRNFATRSGGSAGPDGGRPVSDQTMLEVDGLSKRFGGVTAVGGTTFSVGSGTITGLIGPNGSGKTTVFNLITGYLKADAGSVRFGGEPVQRPNPRRLYRRGLSRTFQQARVFPDTTL